MNRREELEKELAELKAREQDIIYELRSIQSREEIRLAMQSSDWQ